MKRPLLSTPPTPSSLLSPSSLNHSPSAQADHHHLLVYPNHFEGWLTAVFVAYELGLQHSSTLRLLNDNEHHQELFAQTHRIDTDDDKANRVLVKLEQCLGKAGIKQLLWGLLSEQPEIGTVLFRVVKYALDYPHRQVLQDLGNVDVLTLSQTVKSVGREKHRMEAFVRFEHTVDDIYFARVEPDFNVLPLIAPHFARRYQDQNWAIYDLIRGYGIYYQMPNASDAHSKPAPASPASIDTQNNDTQNNPYGLQTITDLDPVVIQNPSSIHSEQEARYQRFWQGYFANVNIKERKNPRLHRQYLPQRYWRYLTEKQVRSDASHLHKKR